MPSLVLAQTDAPRPAPADQEDDPVWTLEAGFSFLQTGGNARTTSAGLDLDFRHQWVSWFFEGGAKGLRATEDKKTSAERYSAELATGRALSQRFHLVGGIKGERDRFAGVGFRGIAGLGVGWTTVEGPRLRLDTTLEGTFTREELLSQENRDSLGGRLGLASRVELSEGSHTAQKLTLFPSLRDSDDFRLEAELSLQAAVNRRLAVKLAYSLRLDNQPAPGFRKRDTTAQASLVVRLEGGG